VGGKAPAASVHGWAASPARTGLVCWLATAPTSSKTQTVVRDFGWLSRRSPRFLGLARVLAWGAGYGAALIVAYDYPSLPDELRLSRWTMAPKSMFLALRVPLINLAMIGLCEILARILGRAPPEQKHVAECAGAALLGPTLSSGTPAGGR